jgi:hypothetical protein
MRFVAEGRTTRQGRRVLRLLGLVMALFPASLVPSAQAQVRIDERERAARELLVAFEGRLAPPEEIARELARDDPDRDWTGFARTLRLALMSDFEKCLTDAVADPRVSGALASLLERPADTLDGLSVEQVERDRQQQAISYGAWKQIGCLSGALPTRARRPGDGWEAAAEGYRRFTSVRAQEPWGWQGLLDLYAVKDAREEAVAAGERLLAVARTPLQAAQARVALGSLELNHRPARAALHIEAAVRAGSAAVRREPLDADWLRVAVRALGLRADLRTNAGDPRSLEDSRAAVELAERLARVAPTLEARCLQSETLTWLSYRAREPGAAEALRRRSDAIARAGYFYGSSHRCPSATAVGGTSGKPSP